MKKFLYIVGIIVVSILLVCGMLVAVLMSDEVETAAVQLVTSELSHALGTEAHVGAVEYRFPARVAMRDIYVEDQQGDTLVYVNEVYAHFSPLALRHDEVRFSHVRLKNVVADVHRLPDSTWNYQFIADAFRSEKNERDPLRSLIAVKDVQLDSVRLRYEDYRLLLSHAKMDLHALSADKLDAEISKLSGSVQRTPYTLYPTPFIVEDMQARVVLTDSSLNVPILMTRLPNSNLALSRIAMRMPMDSAALQAPLYVSAQLTPSDIALFVPSLHSFQRVLALQGAISGSMDSLAVTALSLRYDGKQILNGDVTAVGLQDLTNPYLRANLTDLHTNAAQLQDFLSQLYGRPITLPQPVHRLGDVHYRGLAEGRLHDLTLHGAFRTALGTITTDGTFQSDSTFEHMAYDARVVGRNFRLGRMLDHEKMGTLTLDVASKGQIEDGKVRGEVDAHVRELTYNNYTYNDLDIRGYYAPKHYNGQFAIHDPHLDLSFDGVVDLHDKNPEINFNLLCKHFDSAPLGIETIGDKLKTRFSMAVDMSGRKVDEVSGYMVIDSLFVATSRDSVLMKQLMLLASADKNGGKAITLRTDYMRAQMDGDFHYSDIVPAAQAMMHHYLPAAVAEPKRKWESVEFTMRADGDRLRDVQRLFDAPITLSDHPTFEAKVQLAPTTDPSVHMRFYAPGLRVTNTPVHDLTVNLNSVDTLHSTAEGLVLSVTAEAMEMYAKLTSIAFNDSLFTQLSLHKESVLYDADQYENRRTARLAAQRAGNYGGDISFITHFAQYNRKPLIDLHFMPGELLLRDSVYTLGESRVTWCAADTMLTVERFSFEGGGQFIRAHGLASRRATDALQVDLQKIDASYVVPFFLPQQTIMFNGLLTGKANISGVFRKPKVDTKIHIDSMGLNDCYFGEAEVDLHIADSLAFRANVNRPDRQVVDLKGKALFDGSGRWELDMMADSVPLAFINHWTKNVLRDLDGNGTGRVVVGGRKGLTYVLLKCAAQNASLTLPWTGARYTIAEDTIVMDTTAIIFPNVHLTDKEGNKVEINGRINHDQFKTFALDLHVDAHNALVFDNNEKGEMIQGTVYASGHVDVTGTDDDILVVADAKTSKNSRFRLSLDNVSSAYESSFVHFVSHNDNVSGDSIVETELDNIDIKHAAQVDTTSYLRAGRCLLKLNIEVNPQLLFQLVLGERNGDVIQARGNGALSLTYDTQTSDVSLLGTYDIDQGTLSYTVANMIRKEFTVGEGSTIVFSGDATNPQLDVTAKYRVTANLRDLFGEEADQLATSRSNIPVMTCLHLSGVLNNPILSFSLEFPMSDQSIQQQVKQIINTDEMLMRQVIYLLVFGRFFTPDYMSNAQYATLNSTYSLLSSTVTSQINAWLSKLTDMLTLGVAIRTDGEGADASREYEAQFQLQPVDRLVINGNVGYRYNDVSNQPFFGDLDVEVLLTEDGQWRIKGYTHTVDKYSLRQASTIQGFGFLWKKDF